VPPADLADNGDAVNVDQRPATPPEIRKSDRSGFRRAMGELILPVDVNDAAQFRLQRQANRLRVVFAGIFLVLVPVLPGLSGSERVRIAGVLVIYTASALVSMLVARRSIAIAAALNLLFGHLAVFAISLILPDSLTVIAFAYGIANTANAMLSGLLAGIVATGFSIVLLAIAEWNAPVSSRHDAFTFAVFVVIQLSTVFLVDVLTRERRRVAMNLERLHLAMRAVSSTPSLQETADSVADSVSDSVGADVSGILLLDGDQLSLVAPRNLRAVWPREDLGALTSAELADRETSPLAHCLRTGEAVLIPDVAGDRQYPAWSTLWAGGMHQLGLRSMVMVPLRLSGEPIGVLVACFTWKGAIAEEEVELLQAYADQSSLLMVRAQAYERERLAAEKLAQTDRLKSEFLAMVSHELRTPLTAVKGFVDTVLLHWDRLDDDRRRELLRRASGNADELARLIGQLLDFSRIDADRIEVRPVICSVRELVDSVLHDVSPVLASHTVVVDVSPALRVSCDPEAFDHVIMNLLSNAVKFSPKGSEVRINAREDGEQVVTSVIDHGAGIKEEDLDRIFERFYQSSAPALSRRGTGIGLAIAKRFVDLQGGRIWVESELGVGSTFSFALSNARTTVPDGTSGAVVSRIAGDPGAQ